MLKRVDKSRLWVWSAVTFGKVKHSSGLSQAKFVSLCFVSWTQTDSIKEKMEFSPPLEENLMKMGKTLLILSAFIPV